ncbi:general secretion pathway protein GspK [Pseudooceanicola sp. MF1-13]|uniref:general secretion pathway protein GspK n=1 Tax=Pseudooceanicola sp. MF1-13 TaxID=3379095 RepID=UPI003891C04D
MNAPRRDPEGGVVLINVLVMIALASTVVYLMLSEQETSLSRVARMSDAVQAQNLALGAEASVLDALRADLDTAPDTDHFGEPWTRVIQEEVTLGTGRFSVDVTDLQAKYDIHLLAGPGVGQVELMSRLLQSVDQPPELAPRMAAIVRRVSELQSINDLRFYGIPDPTIKAIAPYVAALPPSGQLPRTVNLNTAPPLLLEALFKNQSYALRLESIRQQTGEITRANLDGIGAIRPENTNWTSGLYDVAIMAEVGDARVRLVSRLVRQNDLGGKSVSVLTRRFMSDAPPQD